MLFSTRPGLRRTFEIGKDDPFWTWWLCGKLGIWPILVRPRLKSVYVDSVTLSPGRNDPVLVCMREVC
jgi:hypothetical protein